MKRKAAPAIAGALILTAAALAAAFHFGWLRPLPAGTAPAGFEPAGAVAAGAASGASAPAAATAQAASAAAEAQTAEALPSTRMPTYDELVKHLQGKPDDARVWVLKARMDLEGERPAQAAEAYAKALGNPRSKVKLDAQVWVEYAEALALAQGGKLVGEPQRQLTKALEVNPLHPQALDLAGSAAWEAGDFRAAASHWKTLQSALEPGSQRLQAVTDAIAAAEQRARVTLPPAPSPPAATASSPAR